MAYTVPEKEPTRIAAGDTWQWTKAAFADFPASDGWALSYAFSGPKAFTANASADGDGFSVTIAAADTKIPAGTYRWQSYVTLGAERYQVGSGILDVTPNLAALTPAEVTESFAVQALRVVETALLGRLPAGLEEYTIAGKLVKHMPLTELYELRSKLRHEVTNERSGGKIARLEVAFVAPR